ncbi:hypothetical protein BH23ACT9_BH23ACT9_39610 [soil metagenome]
MPELRELLTMAAEVDEPAFDAGDVHRRVRAADRRQRRTATAVMASVVVLLAVGIGTTLTAGRTAFVDDLASADRPQTITFAGAEVEVSVAASLHGAMGYVEPGDTITRVAAGTDDDGGVNLWFTCGDAPVFRLREVRDPAVPPALPVAALAETLTQFTAANGCTPELPRGTPDRHLDGGIGLAGLARAIDEAGLTACCASTTLVPMNERSGVSDGGISSFRAAEGSVSWAVEDGSGAPLAFTADFRSWVPSDLTTPEIQPLAGGRVAVQRSDGLIVASTCGMATLQARLADGELPRWEAFLQLIGCTPTTPEGLSPTFDLLDLLGDLGLSAVATPSGDATIAAAQVVVGGETLLVRSGGMGQVGVPISAMDDMSNDVTTFTGTGEAWPADEAYQPLGGAFVVCMITHAVFAESEPGLDLAMDLARQIGGHPQCATVGLPDGAPPMPEALPPSESGGVPTDPERSVVVGVLAQSDDWVLAVTDDQGLELRQGTGVEQRTSGVSDYTLPVTLNEATSFGISQDGGEATLVAGPVDDRATEVRITDPDGDVVSAQLQQMAGLTWFHAVLPGFVSLNEVVAIDAAGQVLDRRTLPPAPPPFVD